MGAPEGDVVDHTEKVTFPLLDYQPVMPIENSVVFIKPVSGVM